MSKFKLFCRGCNKAVNNTPKKLPVTIRNKVHKKDIKGKVIGTIDTVIGYYCAKCATKKVKSGEIKMRKDLSESK